MIPVLRGANIPRQQKANSFVTGSFDYESDVDAYSVYADAAGPIPTLTASGSTDVTIAYNPASPLSGYASLDIVKPSGDRQGVSIASNFRIGLGDRGSVLRFSFKYAIFSGTFPAGTSSVDSNLTAYIYDVTNAVLIPVSDHKLYSDSSSAATFNATFQTSIDSVDYKLILFIGTTDTNAWSMKVDDLVITSAQTISASIITDWQAFPSVAAGVLITGTTSNPTYGTVAQNVAYWRRVGDSMEIIWNYRQTTAGGGGSGTYLFNLPTGYQIDTAKLAANMSVMQSVVGSYQSRRYGSGNVVYFGGVGVYSATQLFATLGGFDNTNNTAANKVWGSTDDSFAADTDVQRSIHATVPIAGWGSSLDAVFSGDDGRVVAAAYYQSSSVVADTSTPVAFQAKEFDTHNMVTLSPFRATVPVSGLYRISGKMQLSSGATVYIRLYKNGSYLKPLGWLDNNAVGEYTGTVELKAGDYIDVRPSGSVTISGNATQANDLSSTIHIEKLGGNAVAVAYAGVARDCMFRAHGWAGYGSGTNIPYFSTVDKDTSSGFFTYTNDATNGLSLTVTQSGVYSLVWGYLINTPTYAGISLNSSQLSTPVSKITASTRLAIGTSSAVGYTANPQWTGYLNAGDVIRPHTNGYGSSNDALAYLTFCKIA